MLVFDRGRLWLTVPSPYVRRHWLAREIRRLRHEHRCSGEELARAVGFPRQHVSMLENARRGPDIDLVSGICDLLQVGARRRDAIMSAASDGWAIGWWEEAAAAMGERQARYADLESGTRWIGEYALALFPGLLQTKEFAIARARSDPARQSPEFDPDVSVAARVRRQEQLLSPDGPRYELVLDELAIRRAAAEPVVVAGQLRNIVAVCTGNSAITVQVLPLHARITSHSAPRSAYSIYRYRDGHDTLAVAADTLTCDLVLIDPDQIEPYRELHSRLRAAALTAPDSMALLTAVADSIDTEGDQSWPTWSSLAGGNPPAAMPAVTASKLAGPSTAA